MHRADVAGMICIPQHAGLAAGKSAREELRSHGAVAAERAHGKFAQKIVPFHDESGVNRPVVRRKSEIGAEHAITKQTYRITRTTGAVLLFFAPMDEQHPLTQAVIRGRRKEVPELVKQCLNAGEDAKSILENRLVPGMAIVGERFKKNEIFVPVMLVAAAARFIRERAVHGCRVEDVLQHVRVSRSFLERGFRKYLKRSPQEEIRALQLNRVKQLLNETDFTLERIAGLSGFEHPEYMSVVFKRLTGQTPGTFRKQFGKPVDAKHREPR